jgi:hypothetical protein
MLRQARRKFALDRQDRIVGVRACEHIENVIHALQRLATPLQRQNGVLKRRRRGIVRDRLDLRVMLDESPRISGLEMLGLDLGERRHLERSRPVCKKWIVVCARGVLLTGHAILSTSLRIADPVPPAVLGA